MSALICLLCVFMSGVALAAEPLEADARLAAVELYPDGARLTHVARLELDAGRQTVVLRGLPEKLDPGAIEVTIVPAEAAGLAALDFRTQAAAEPVHPRERELVTQIRELERERDLRRDRIEAGRLQLELLRHLAQFAGGLTAGELRPETWRRGWEILGTGALQILTKIRDSQYELAELERGIEAAKRQLEQIATGARGEGLAEIELEVLRAGPLELHLVYEHPDAGFRSAYEADLVSDRGLVRFRQRAVMRQRSGQDWQDVALVLASVRAQGRPSPPEPQPWFIDIQELRPLPRGITSEAMPEGPVAARLAVGVEKAPFAVRYRLAEPVDLPADGRERTVTLSEASYEVRPLVTAYPAEDPAAYVLARFTYAGDVPLLPGELRLFRDGVAAGRDDLPAVAPGAELRLGFGRDDAVQIERRLDTGFRSEEGIFETRRRVERHYLIRVRNGHDRPVEIEVLDRMPVPQDERIEVELTQETTPPSERDVRGRRGVLAWRYVYAPNEEREIRFGFAVMFPKDVDVDGFGGGG